MSRIGNNADRPFSQRDAAHWGVRVIPKNTRRPQAHLDAPAPAATAQRFAAVCCARAHRVASTLQMKSCHWWYTIIGSKI